MDSPVIEPSRTAKMPALVQIVPQISTRGGANFRMSVGPADEARTNPVPTAIKTSPAVCGVSSQMLCR